MGAGGNLAIKGMQPFGSWHPPRPSQRRGKGDMAMIRGEHVHVLQRGRRHRRSTQGTGVTLTSALGGSSILALTW